MNKQIQPSVAPFDPIAEDAEIEHLASFGSLEQTEDFGGLSLISPKNAAKQKRREDKKVKINDKSFSGLSLSPKQRKMATDLNNIKRKPYNPNTSEQVKYFMPRYE